jgi:uncharacterized protein (UPF0332 family)
VRLETGQHLNRAEELLQVARENIRPGHLDARLHASFRKAFDARNESDYLPAPSETATKADALLREAQEFVSACKAWLEKRAT